MRPWLLPTSIHTHSGCEDSGRLSFSSLGTSASSEIRLQIQFAQADCILFISVGLEIKAKAVCVQ